METVIFVLHLVVAAALIGLVLLQQGKGADMGTAFGSGASSTVFGSQGSASFLTRSTAVMATLFFITSLSLAVFSAQGTARKSVTEAGGSVVVEEEVEQQAAPRAEDMPVLPDAAEQAAGDDVPAADVPAKEQQ
jgi:preprotein translocase subunit SecG